MKKINWNQMSELGLIERINREILHPLGLAVSRNPENGSSEAILVADDGVWEYGNMPTTVLNDEEFKDKFMKMISETQ